MSTFKPIRQPRVSEEVIQQLKQAFIVGHFKAGDKLPPVNARWPRNSK